MYQDGPPIVFPDVLVRDSNSEGGVTDGAHVRMLETEYSFRCMGDGTEFDDRG